MESTCKKLIEGHQIPYQPNVAVRFGLNESVIIEQIYSATKRPETSLQFDGIMVRAKH